MSADKNPTTVAPLMAERDRKISSPNGVRGLICVWFFCPKSVIANLFRADEISDAEKSRSPRFAGLSRYRL
jgi:hypothetical protein